MISAEDIDEDGNIIFGKGKGETEEEEEWEDEPAN